MINSLEVFFFAAINEMLHEIFAYFFFNYKDLQILKSGEIITLQNSPGSLVKTGLVKTEFDFIVRSVETNLGRCMVLVVVCDYLFMLIVFLLSQT